MISNSTHVVIGAGAGFSVDSGLKTYTDIAKVPEYKQLGFNYADLCDPSLQNHTETLKIFLGFWGTCYNDYENAKPHEGYQILYDIITAQKKPHFILTSNVDGFFKRIFKPENVHEIHGATTEWQCSGPCSCFVYQFQHSFRFRVSDEMTFNWTNKHCQYQQGSVTNISKFDETKPITIIPAQDALPVCFKCQKVLRPRVLMFDDGEFIEDEEEQENWQDFRKQCKKSGNVTILEFGCGLRVPTIRIEMEKLLRACPKGNLVRINPAEEKLQSMTFRKCPNKVVHIKTSALEFATGLIADQPKQE